MAENGDNRMVITCPHCLQRFSVAIPPTSIYNDPRSSSSVSPHEKPIRCICGKYCQVAIESMKVTWIVLPLSDEQARAMEPNRIVVPDKPLNLKLN